MKQFSKLFKTSSFLAVALTQRRAFAAIKVNQEELKQRLDRLTYHVTQEKGTERPFSGDYYHNKEAGDYLCVVCGEKLFRFFFLFLLQICSMFIVQQRNMIQDQDGHLSMIMKKEKLQLKLTILMV